MDVSDNNDGDRDSEIYEVLEAALLASQGFLASSSQDMRVFMEETVRAAVHYLHQPPTLTLI